MGLDSARQESSASRARGQSWHSSMARVVGRLAMSDCGCLCHGGHHRIGTPRFVSFSVCVCARVFACSCLWVSWNQVWHTRSLDNREYHGCFGLVLPATFLFPRQLVLKCLLWFLHGFVSAWEVQPGQPHTAMHSHVRNTLFCELRVWRSETWKQKWACKNIRATNGI